MGFKEILFYFSSLSIAAATIIVSHRLNKQYAYRFLHYYFNYIVFFYVFGFLNFTGRMLVVRIFNQSTNELHTAGQVVGLIASPVLITSLYFANFWIRRLLGKSTPTVFRITFWAIQGAVLTVFVFGVTNLVKMKGFTLAGPIFQATFAIELVFIILILLQLFFSNGPEPDINRKRLAKHLGCIYLFGFALLVLFGLVIRVPLYIYPDLLFFQVIIAFLYFFINIPPLVYLSIFLKKHHGKLGLLPGKTRELGSFFSRFNITAREQEIIDRIIKGKTNEEIGDELFISTKTVKNNISNIYKKMGVNNRVQLTNLIRDI